MKSYITYRDGEEIERGLLGMLLDRIHDFIRTCRESDWKHFFQGNGPGEVTWKKFTGFKEHQDSVGYSAQWLIGVKGGIRPREGNYYYLNITETEFSRIVDVNTLARVREKIAAQEKILDLYASPECTCRRGFHWKCRHHQKWER